MNTAGGAGGFFVMGLSYVVRNIDPSKNPNPKSPSKTFITASLLGMERVGEWVEGRLIGYLYV